MAAVIQARPKHLFSIYTKMRRKRMPLTQVIDMFGVRIIVGTDEVWVADAVVKELYANPLHPYTVGLLGSLPRLDMLRERLTSIDGLPPTLYEEPKYCPFAPRCAFVQEKCWQENPPLVEVAPKHEIACWVDVKTGALR